MHRTIAEAPHSLTRVSQRENMMRCLLKGVRRRVVLLCLSVFALSCSTPYNPTLPPSPVAPPPSGSLLKSQLRIGVSPDYEPLAYKDKPLGLVGIEVDFANQLGKELGKEIVFVEIPFPELIKALLEERVDIIMSGMSITNERARLVNFTDPYSRNGQMALVRAKDVPSYPNVAAFLSTTGKIGFVQDTTGELAARGVFKRATVAPQPTISQGIGALRKGEIDVFIHDAPTIWRVAGNPNEKELGGLYWPLTEENLAWAVRKSDEPLRFALNSKLAEWKDNGRLKLIITRWVNVKFWAQ